MIANYRWRSRNLLWLWPVVAALLFLTVRRERLLPGFLLALGLMASATSMLCWQQQYSVFAAHLDPDHYGAYGERLADFVSGNGDAGRAELVNWFHEFSNAHGPLTSVFLAGLHLLGLPVPIAYIWLNGVCAFATLLVVHHMLRKSLDLSAAGSALTVALVGGHLLLLKSFARPGVDMPGLLLATLMFGGILWRFKEANIRQTIGLSLLPLLLLLTRHGTLTYLPFYVLAILFADGSREGSWRPWPHLRTAVQLVVPPLLIYVGIFFVFGWQHNFLEALERNRNDSRFHSPTDLTIALSSLVQFLALGWLLVPGRLRSGRHLRPAVLLCLVWFLHFSMVMLLVHASFVHRLFLPLLPALAIGFAVGIDRLAENRPKLVTGAVVFAAACNVAVAGYVIYLHFLPPVQVSRFIY